MNLLNQESDVLEERNRQLDTNIGTFQTLVTMSEQEKQQKLIDMRLKAESLRNEIVKAN